MKKVVDTVYGSEETGYSEEEEEEEEEGEKKEEDVHVTSGSGSGSGSGSSSSSATHSDQHPNRTTHKSDELSGTLQTIPVIFSLASMSVRAVRS
jgi:hypothetical protein